MRLVPLVILLATIDQVSAVRRRKSASGSSNSPTCPNANPATVEEAFLAGEKLASASLRLTRAFLSAQPDTIREACNETPSLCDDNVFPVDVVLNRLNAFKKTNISGVSFLEIVQMGGELPEDLKRDIRAHKRLRTVKKQFGLSEKKLGKQEKTIMKVSKHLAELANKKAQEKVVPIPGKDEIPLQDFDAADVESYRSAFSSNSEDEFEAVNIDELPVASDFGVEAFDEEEPEKVVLRKRSLKDGSSNKNEANEEIEEEEEEYEVQRPQPRPSVYPANSYPSSLSYPRQSSSVLKSFFGGIMRVLSFAGGIIVFLIGWILTVLAFITGVAAIFIAGVIGIPVGFLVTAGSCALQCLECCLIPVTCCCGMSCELTKASQAYKHTCDCCFMPRKMSRCTAVGCAAPMVYAAASLADFGLYMMGAGGENYRIAARRLESRFR